MPPEQLLGGRGHLGELGAVDGLDEGLPVGEMAVQRADPDARVAGDRLERGRRAVLGERRGGRLQQPLAIAARIRPSTKAEAPPFLLR